MDSTQTVQASFTFLNILLKVILPIIGAIILGVTAYIPLKKYLNDRKKHAPKLFSRGIEGYQYHITIEDYSEKKDLRIIDVYFKDYYRFRYKKANKYHVGSFEKRLSINYAPLVDIYFENDVLMYIGTLKIVTSEGKLYEHIHPVIYDKAPIKNYHFLRLYRYNKFIKKYDAQYKI